MVLTFHASRQPEISIRQSVNSFHPVSVSPTPALEIRTIPPHSPSHLFTFPSLTWSLLRQAQIMFSGSFCRSYIYIRIKFSSSKNDGKLLDVPMKKRSGRKKRRNLQTITSTKTTHTNTHACKAFLAANGTVMAFEKRSTTMYQQDIDSMTAFLTLKKHTQRERKSERHPNKYTPNDNNVKEKTNNNAEKSF